MTATIRFEDFLEKNPRAYRALVRENNEFFIKEGKYSYIQAPNKLIRIHIGAREMIPRQMTPLQRERAKKLEKRVARMIELRKQGVKLARIAEEFGVSRQRIDQLAHAYLPQELLPVRHEDIIKTCPCGEQFKVSWGLRKKKYHTKECGEKYRKKARTPEEARLAMRTRIRYRYHNDPVFRAKRIQQTSVWHKKEWAKGGEYRKKTEAYQRAWRKNKYDNDPAFRERERLANKVSREKWKAATPNWRDIEREHWLKWKEKKIAAKIKDLRENFPEVVSNMTDEHIRRVLKGSF